jgi:hypothetical protein
VWAALLLVLASLPARAGTGDVAGVRSTNAAIREMLDDGAWESPTFRGLVRAIVAHNGIVYVEDGVCLHGVHACLLMNVTPASGYRILQIVIDRQGVMAHRRRLDVIATIGHELCHAPTARSPALPPFSSSTRARLRRPTQPSKHAPRSPLV